MSVPDFETYGSLLFVASHPWLENDVRLHQTIEHDNGLAEMVLTDGRNAWACLLSLIMPRHLPTQRHKDTTSRYIYRKSFFR